MYNAVNTFGLFRFVRTYILLCYLLPVTALSQVLSLHSYTQSDGLVSNDVTALHQDSRGFLWIGTYEGLSMYDGVEFTNYRTNDGLPSNSITCIIESKKTPGMLYLGSRYGGIAKKLQDHFEVVYLDTIREAQFIEDILEDHTGALWCATPAGFYRRGLDGVTSRLPVSFKAFNVGRIIEASDSGSIWIWLNDSVLQYRTDGSFLRRIVLNTNKVIFDGDWIADGPLDLWLVSSNQMLYRIINGELAGERRLPQQRPNFILEGRDDDLWIGTVEGLLRISKERFLTDDFTIYSIDNGLPKRAIIAGVFDREQNLWMGLANGGLLKLSNQSLLTFPFKEIPSAYNNARAVSDSSQHYWVLTQDGVKEIWFSQGGVWNTASHSLNAPPDVKKHFIGKDNQGQIWVELADRLQCYTITSNADRASTLTLKQTLKDGIDIPRGGKHAFLIDKDDRLWISIANLGVVCYDLRAHRSLRTFGIADGVPDLSVRVLYQDSPGNLWIGGFLDGLAVVPAASDLTTDKLKTFSVKDGLPDNQIRSVHEDHSGRIWIGTRYGGLAYYEDGKFSTITTRDGLLSNAVWAMAEDKRGERLWLATQMGLQAVDLQTLKPDIMSTEFRGYPVGSVGTTQDNTVWYVWEGGFSIYRAEALGKMGNWIPQIHIRNLAVNGQTIDPHNGLELSSEQNNVLIDYIAVTLTDQRSIRYSYRLLGSTESWSLPSSVRSVSFAALAPGAYTFQVRAMMANEHSYSPSEELSFTIIPPLWQRWWFVSGVFVVGVAALAFAVRVRIRRADGERLAQIEFSRRLIELQEDERKRIASELHDSLGQNLLILKNGIQQYSQQTKDIEGVTEGLEQLSDVAMQSINEVREISYDLHPHVLDRLGLKKGIESALNKFSLSSPMKLAVEIDDIDGLFPKEAEINIYRILQEGMNNIAKHARASEVSVRVLRVKQSMSIIVKDNGKGFDVKAHSAPRGARNGLGLMSIGERVKFLSGTWAITSIPEQGTTLTVTITIPEGRL